MAQCQGQVELKMDAYKFFNTWTDQTSRVPEILPEKYTKVELHEGTHWHSLGAVKTWTYVVEGRQESLKTKVTGIDEKSTTVQYLILDGDMMKENYKSFKSKIEAIPKADDKGCFVKWSIEYEKKTEDAPDADIYIDFLLGVAKDMDARLCNA